MNETANGMQAETTEQGQGDQPDTAATRFERIDDYEVPVDPMTSLECESCQ